MEKDEAVRQVAKAAAARQRAQTTLTEREVAEEIALQDGYLALGPGYGSITKLAEAASRSREHIRRVLDPKQQRGRHRPTA